MEPEYWEYLSSGWCPLTILNHENLKMSEPQRQKTTIAQQNDETIQFFEGSWSQKALELALKGKRPIWNSLDPLLSTSFFAPPLPHRVNPLYTNKLQKVCFNLKYLCFVTETNSSENDISQKLFPTGLRLQTWSYAFKLEWVTVYF